MDRHKIMLGLPGPAPASWHIAFSAFLATQGRHQLQMENSGGSSDNFNMLWVEALNRAKRGEITHFAMQHADVLPEPGWLNVLLEEMDATNADMVSVSIPIKGTKNTSSGILIGAGEWPKVRCFTLEETEKFPQTWNAELVGYPGGILVHNNGLWVADMRKPVWREKHPGPDGELKCYFKFRRQVYEDPETGEVKLRVLSEDFAFSQQIIEAGAKTFITKRVKLSHFGSYGFANHATDNALWEHASTVAEDEKEDEDMGESTDSNDKETQPAEAAAAA